MNKVNDTLAGSNTLDTLVYFTNWQRTWKKKKEKKKRKKKKKKQKKNPKQNATTVS